MTALANARPIARYGDPNTVEIPIYGPVGIAANTLIYGGALVATDASGNMVDAAAAAAVAVVGVARKTYYNRTTDPSGGAAGAVQGEFLAGAFPFFISTLGGAITNANRWQTVYVVDDQTVSLAGGVGTGLPVGKIIYVDALGGPTNGMVWVQISVGAGLAGTSILHTTIDVPLTAIQAATSGTAFNVGNPLPANALVIATDLNLIQVVAGGTIATAVAKLQNTGETAGALLGGAAGVNVFTGATLGKTQTPVGTSPLQLRGGQQLQCTIATTTDTPNHATTGHFQFDLYYSIVP
jgi:hypothetical protein